MSQDIIEWDLSAFYEKIEDPRIQEDLEKIQNDVEDFIKLAKGKLDFVDSQQLKPYLERYEKIREQLTYLRQYANLLYSTNALDDDIKAFKARIEEFETKIIEKILFFNLELNSIEENKFTELVNDELLSNYKHYLVLNRRRKPHQLTEKEEQIILMKDLTGARGFHKLHSEITSGYIHDFEIEGEIKKLTTSELLSYMFGEDRELRKKALHTFVERLKEDELVFTHIYNNIIKDFDKETKKRNYTEPIDSFNLTHETSGMSVKALEKATTDSYDITEKYYLIKKKLLGLDELHMYDIYAPIGKIAKKYTFAEAMEVVKTAAGRFSEEFKNIIEQMETNNHIDATPRKGKRGGAFCSYGKLKQLPFAFVNFTGNISSILTLAHELGHAIHMYFTLQTQNFLNIYSTLPMAEIASVFMEIMTFDYLLKQDLTKEEQIALLAKHLEGNFGTSHRQNAFHRFELQIHELMEKRLPTTKDYITMFTTEIQNMYRSSISNIVEEYSHYCFIVHHFIAVPFYVYAYNMSNMMVIALYQMYLEGQKEEFKAKYKKMLSTGSARTPDEIVAEFGINLSDPTFWAKGTQYLRSKVDEIEKLA